MPTEKEIEQEQVNEIHLLYSEVTYKLKGVEITQDNVKIFDAYKYWQCGCRLESVKNLLRFILQKL